MKCDLVIKAEYVLPMDKKMSIIQDGLIAVNNKIIIDIGKTGELEKKYKPKKIINAGYGIALPGLINTHTHAAMVYFRGLADDLPLNIWLEKHIWPAEKKYVKPQFVRQASELACLEMIKSGITCFSDMYFFVEQTIAAAQTAGLRIATGEGIIDFPTPSCRTPKEAIKKTIKLINRYQNNELVKINFAPHSIYTCSKRTLLEAKEAATDKNSLIHIHVSETKKEKENCQKEHQLTPVAYLAKIGLFNQKVIAAHSVWLEEKDLAIYKNKKVGVSHCPTSNMKLASGAAPLPAMLSGNIAVGLGTDGAASNNTLNMFQEMKITALLPKVYNLKADIAKAADIVKMATISGAKILNWDNKIGSLEVGKRADIITVSLNKPHLVPCFNPYSHLVYSATAQDVEDVIIDGEIIMQKREIKTMDEEKIIYQAKKFNP